MIPPVLEEPPQEAVNPEERPEDPKIRPEELIAQEVPETTQDVEQAETKEDAWLERYKWTPSDAQEAELEWRASYDAEVQETVPNDEQVETKDDAWLERYKWTPRDAEEAELEWQRSNERACAGADWRNSCPKKPGKKNSCIKPGHRGAQTCVYPHACIALAEADHASDLDSTTAGGDFELEEDLDDDDFIVGCSAPQGGVENQGGVP